MRLGAFDYYVKTDEEDRIVAGVLRAVRMQELQRENVEMTSRFLDGAPQPPGGVRGIVTQDRTMRTLFSYVEAVAKSPQPLLITGERGVGKELVARAAHQLSGCKGPLVAVNVAGLDDTVFADTLFGHVRGAFTGADQARRGIVEEAADGTLFLDEIGDLSIASQVKLLRFLQEGEYFPLGSDRPKRVSAGSSSRRTRTSPRRRRPGSSAATSTTGSARTASACRRCASEGRHAAAPRPLPRGRRARARQEEADRAEAARPAPRDPRLPRERARAEGDGVRRGVAPQGAGALDGGVPRRDRRARGTRAERGAEPEENPFPTLERLPTFDEALQLLVEEAMARAGGNQTLASRLLGISQPALSKRLKAYRTDPG